MNYWKFGTDVPIWLPFQQLITYDLKFHSGPDLNRNDLAVLKLFMNKSVPSVFRSHELWDCSVSYVVIPNNANQSFYGYMVVVGLDGSFDSEIEGQRHENLRGYILNRKARHTCIGNKVKLLISVVEPGSVWGRRFAGVLGMKPFVRIEEILNNADHIAGIFDSGGSLLDRKSLMSSVERLFDALLANDRSRKGKPMDPRISFMLQHIENNLGETIELARIADLIHLSPERVRHLFTEQVGMPFTKYILWRRLRKVIYTADAKQMRLNQAVSQFGFSDQAHFNHVFKKVFGTSPKLFLQMTSSIF